MMPRFGAEHETAHNHKLPVAVAPYSRLTAAVKRIVPLAAVARVAATRNSLRALRGDLLRARAEAIPFYSGLGDSANLLYGFVRAMKPQVCVEIGSARGRSTCFIAMALKENGHGILHAIDPHSSANWNEARGSDTFKILNDNISKLGLSHQVSIIRSTSESAAAQWNCQIDMLFIDGDHSYEGVKSDWRLFKRFVHPFGVVVFHDTLWDLRPDPQWTRADMGVPRFVDELRSRGYPVITIERDFGVSIVQPTIGGNRLRPGR
jgi:predicted O-methyltransferase YrrM